MFLIILVVHVDGHATWTDNSYNNSQWSLLLTWINFNLSMDKQSHQSVEENTKIRNVTKDRNFGAKITYVSNISNLHNYENQ